MSTTVRFLRPLFACLSIFAMLPSIASAQRITGLGGPPKQVPPAGIEVPAADRAELERGLAALDSAIKDLSASKDARVKSLLPDVQIFQRAVNTALKDNEFFAPAEIARAKDLLAEGRTRAEQLAQRRSAVDQSDRTGGARLRFENRWLGSADRVGRAGVVHARSATTNTDWTFGCTAAAKI